MQKYGVYHQIFEIWLEEENRKTYFTLEQIHGQNFITRHTEKLREGESTKSHYDSKQQRERNGGDVL